MAKVGNVSPIKSTADKFREKTLGSNSTRKTETATVDVNGEPLQVVLKTPSLSGQESAQEAAGMEFVPTGTTNAKGEPEFKSVIKYPLRYSVELVILSCFEPQFGPGGEVTGPGKAIFNSMDRDALMEEAMDGWLKALSDKVIAFGKAKPEAAAKNSEATPDASSSSPSQES